MSEVNAQMIYDCFGEVYKKAMFPQYTDKQVSVTETCTCLTKSFYGRRLGYKLMDSKTVILSFGRLVHEGLREPLLKRGFKPELEGVMPINGIELYAHGDSVRDDCGIDHKTISRIPEAPLIHHFYQSNAYMFVLDRPKWYINYIHKPSGIVKVFPIERLERAFQWNCLRAIRLSHCLKSNTTPQPEPSWLCRYCEYKLICPAWRHG